MASVVMMSACDEREQMDWTDWMGSDGCRKRARVCASPLEPRRSRTGERALCLSVPPYLPIQAHWDFTSLVEWLAPERPSRPQTARVFGFIRQVWPPQPASAPKT